MLNYQYIICPAFPFSSEIWFFWKSVLKWNDQQYYLCSTSPEFHLPPPSPSITVSPSLWRIVCPAFLEQGCLRHSRTGAAPQQSLLEMNCEFSMLKIKSQSNPFDLGSIIWESWHIIHHIKPTQGVYLEVKGFQDLPTYSWEKYHVTIQWNFWTHCRLGWLWFGEPPPTRIWVTTVSYFLAG